MSEVKPLVLNAKELEHHLHHWTSFSETERLRIKLGQFLRANLDARTIRAIAFSRGKKPPPRRR